MYAKNNGIQATSGKSGHNRTLDASPKQHDHPATSDASFTPQLLQLQRQVGNKATIQLLRSHQNPIQMRPIDASIYSDFDKDKARSSTKSLLLAAQQEDEIISWAASADSLQAKLTKLTADEMVGEKAAAEQEACTALITTIKANKEIIRAKVSSVIQNYQAALDPKIYKNEFRNIKAIASRLAAKNQAKSDQDTIINEKIREEIASIPTFYNPAKDNFNTLKDKLDGLQRQSITLKLAKAGYDKQKTRLDTEKKDVFPLADELGIEVPAALEELSSAAEVASSNKDWTTAGAKSEGIKAILDKINKEVNAAKANKSQYESTQGDLAKCKGIEAEFARLRIKDSSEVIDMKEFRKQAIAAYGDKKWAAANADAKKAIQLIDKLDGIADQFRAYQDGADPKLLLGTILRVHANLNARADYNDSDTLAALQETYENQCSITRENWLTHLGIAGDNVKIGPDSDHYTTFNNSVPAFATLSVDTYNTVDSLCDELFENPNEFRRIHATRVVGVERYHKYWGDVYSNNVQDNDLENSNPVAYGQLNTRYDQMRADMRAQISIALQKHGRVGTNNLSQQTIIPN